MTASARPRLAVALWLVVLALGAWQLSRTSDRTTEILDFGVLRNVILTSDKGTVGVFRVSARTSLVSSTSVRFAVRAVSAVDAT